MKNLKYLFKILRSHLGTIPVIDLNDSMMIQNNNDFIL